MVSSSSSSVVEASSCFVVSAVGVGFVGVTTVVVDSVVGGTVSGVKFAVVSMLKIPFLKN